MFNSVKPAMPKTVHFYAFLFDFQPEIRAMALLNKNA